MYIDQKRFEELDILQKRIGIVFKHLETLNHAFIHPSFTNEQNPLSAENNQRMEFLGDAVLELVVSHYLFENYSDLAEGQMTKVRAYTVCEQSLSWVAKNLGLGNYLILGKGEENTGGREKPSILADTFESLIGAIYLERGFDTAKDFIIKNLRQTIQKAVEGEAALDYKTTLQEILQKMSPDRICYDVIREEGPDHAKVFYVEVVWRGKILGRGQGKSKKEAEQFAAKEALEYINNGKYNI